MVRGQREKIQNGPVRDKVWRREWGGSTALADEGIDCTAEI